MPETLTRVETAGAEAALTTILERYWGYPSFRPLQREATAAILAGRDSLVVLPTGGGKSRGRERASSSSDARKSSRSASTSASRARTPSSVGALSQSGNAVGFSLFHRRSQTHSAATTWPSVPRIEGKLLTTWAVSWSSPRVAMTSTKRALAPSQTSRQAACRAPRSIPPHRPAGATSRTALAGILGRAR